ncbi:hypothetical protein QCE64_37060 [Caballeronia sp. LZ043]|nr:hypothetical protein [Caballeronia sp. LZ043]
MSAFAIRPIDFRLSNPICRLSGQKANRLLPSLPACLQHVQSKRLLPPSVSVPKLLESLAACENRMLAAMANTDGESQAGQ